MGNFNQEVAMIKVSINNIQQKELERFRALASSKNSEKGLMVLLNSEGKTVSQIAKTLKCNPHTVRDWLKRYNVAGIKGLSKIHKGTNKGLTGSVTESLRHNADGNRVLRP
jgi:transposase